MNSLKYYLVLSLFKDIYSTQSLSSVNKSVVNEQSNDDKHLSYEKVNEKEKKTPDKRSDYYEKLEIRRLEIIKTQEEERRKGEGEIVARLAQDNKELIEIEKNFNALREKMLKNDDKDKIVTDKGEIRTYQPKDHVHKRFPFRNPINYTI